MAQVCEVERTKEICNDREDPPPSKGIEMYVGKLPRDVFEDKLNRIFSTIGTLSSIREKTKNRVFAFVEYVNHRAASKTRRKLIPNRIQLWGTEIAVDWVE
ncbi:hypothetical protein DAPPUDRAFT_311150 [Daphnia pulex]|uniref:RRM domain-containing protein n=1 Tax=Daphnia pulex TaxID=6669 RepID=E9FUU0_DAPPU|nr:hypothetical protein DAPPUDRAFT_311150 [Daphnia pulex]|eukprot:EFX88785.1 hypothetical protein DAPPUDRAFT_311150 [Daphnia pulex]